MKSKIKSLLFANVKRVGWETIERGGAELRGAFGGAVHTCACVNDDVITQHNPNPNPNPNHKKN